MERLLECYRRTLRSLSSTQGLFRCTSLCILAGVPPSRSSSASRHRQTRHQQVEPLRLPTCWGRVQSRMRSHSRMRSEVMFEEDRLGPRPFRSRKMRAGCRGTYLLLFDSYKPRILHASIVPRAVRFRLLSNLSARRCAMAGFDLKVTDTEERDEYVS